MIKTLLIIKKQTKRTTKQNSGKAKQKKTKQQHNKTKTSKIDERRRTSSHYSSSMQVDDPRTPTCGNMTLNGAPAKAQIAHGMIVGVPFRQLCRSLAVHDSNTTSRFILVRHGESTSNKEGLLCGGGTDTGLSEVGKRQARDVAACLKAEMVDLEALGSSNLIRALQRGTIGQHLPNLATGLWRRTSKNDVWVYGK